MERLFVIIGRINSILFLIILLGAAIFIASMMMESNRWERRGAVEVPDGKSGSKKPMLVSFEKIENITGANVQMLQLTTKEKSEKFSSGGYGTETRNVLFLAGTEKTARWLFKDHNNLIFVASQLREESIDSEKEPTQALYFEYVAADTDGDGKLSSTDRSNIGLSKPDGTGFLEVLHDVSRIFSYEMLDQQHLSVIYQKGATVRHAKFSVAPMKLEADQEIINVPYRL